MGYHGLIQSKASVTPSDWSHTCNGEHQYADTSCFKAVG